MIFLSKKVDTIFKLKTYKSQYCTSKSKYIHAGRNTGLNKGDFVRLIDNQTMQDLGRYLVVSTSNWRKGIFIYTRFKNRYDGTENTKCVTIVKE